MQRLAVIMLVFGPVLSHTFFVLRLGVVWRAVVCCAVGGSGR